MPSQVFVPASLSGADYTGGVGAIDEGLPPAGGGPGEQIQTANTASGGTRSGEVGLDVSASAGFGPIQARFHHTGTQSGGWRVALQLKVGGIAVGSVITRDRVGSAGAMRTSVFNWPVDEHAEISAAIEADPTDVALAWTATNLHASNQQHRIDNIVLIISATAAEPALDGIDWTPVVAAYDIGVSGPDHLTPDDPVLMLPDLKGLSHVALATGTAPVYIDTDPDVPLAIDFGAGRFATTLEVAAPGYEEFDLITLIRTPVTMPTGDSDSVVNVAGWSGAAIGFEDQYNVVMSAIAAGTGGAVFGFLIMCGPVGAENDHLRDNVEPDNDTWYVCVVRVRSAANELLYAHLADGGPPVAGDLTIDAQGASGTNTLLSFGIGSRADGSRFYTGLGSAWWFLDGSLSEAELLDYAAAVAALHGLVALNQGGAGATVNVSAAGAGREGFSAGAGATVNVSAAGAGTAGWDFSDGAGTTVEVSVAGAGVQTSPSAGGAAAVVVVTAAGAGRPAVSAGAGATVNVSAVGAGVGSESFLGVYEGPWVGSAAAVVDDAAVSAGG